MINNIPPRKVIYFLMVLVCIGAFLHIVTDSQQFLNVVTLIAGIIGIIRPKIILEFFQDENKRGMGLDPMFSEKFYIILGYGGGIVLIILGLGRLFFNLNI